MNLLDEIHQYLQQHGPASESDVARDVTDQKVISRNKVTEDLHRLLKAGRVTKARNGTWAVKS